MSGDAQFHRSQHAGGGPPRPVAVEVFATLLHRHARDTATMLRFMADRLANVLPEAVTILRRLTGKAGRPMRR